MNFKPMLASDVVLDKLAYPVLGQPKIDGVRALHMNGKFCGRSLKRFASLHLNEQFDKEEFAGFDGELAAEVATHPRLCSLTTSATSTIKGPTPRMVWHLFDYITAETCELPYWDRYQALLHRVVALRQSNPELASLLEVVPTYMMPDEEHFISFNAYCLDEGYEGSIVRDPKGKHKSGRSTVKEMGLLRRKIFSDAEAVVCAVKEGRTNGNPLTTNELGYAERSTHAEHMVPNGLVGRLIARDVETKEMVDIAPGRLTHVERKYYLEHPEKIVGKVVKYQHFDKGVKEKRRFPTFQCFRDPVDMS